MLRETAQTPAEDEAAFQDVSRHRYFNANSLWVSLERSPRCSRRAAACSSCR